MFWFGSRYTTFQNSRPDTIHITLVSHECLTRFLVSTLFGE